MPIISDKFVLRRFRPTRRGRYWGEALCELPSGDVRRVAVFYDSVIYFGPAGSNDAELFTGGGLERELQTGLRAALLEVHPELLEDPL